MVGDFSTDRLLVGSWGEKGGFSFRTFAMDTYLTK